MDIDWNKCSVLMQPYNSGLIIARIGDEPCQVGTGEMLGSLLYYVESEGAKAAPGWRWTAYSDELWQSVKTK